MAKKFSERPANSLRAAFEQDKQTANVRYRRGMERIAEFMNNMRTATLYDWIEELRMPVSALAAWEQATGGSAVLRYLASQGGRLLIDIPRGKPHGAADVQGLQGVTHAAIGALIAFGEGQAEADQTMAALLHAMQALAWHRENVRKNSQPELDLGDKQ